MLPRTCVIVTFFVADSTVFSCIYADVRRQFENSLKLRKRSQIFYTSSAFWLYPCMFGFATCLSLTIRESLSWFNRPRKSLVNLMKFPSNLYKITSELLCHVYSSVSLITQTPVSHSFIHRRSFTSFYSWSRRSSPSTHLAECKPPPRGSSMSTHIDRDLKAKSPKSKPLALREAIIWPHDAV